MGIPGQLLTAVALAESGRWHKDAAASFAWPWTVTAEGKGRFFASKGAAIEHVETLRARGVRNIDVGCMQINLLHHPHAFADLEQALDPQANVAYAANFLKQLFEQSRSWPRAVGFYHSATQDLHDRYRDRVMKLWTQERRRSAEAKRQEVMAAYQQRRLAAQEQLRLRQMASSAAHRPASWYQASRAASIAEQAILTPSTTAPAATAPDSVARSAALAPSLTSPATPTRRVTPGRILPRGTAVPFERRF